MGDLTPEDRAALAATVRLPPPVFGLAAVTSKGKLSPPPPPQYFTDPTPQAPPAVPLVPTTATLMAKPMGYWDKKRAEIFTPKE